MPEVHRAATPREAVEKVQVDLREFQAKNKLDQVVVANVASTEPPCPLDDRHTSIAKFRAAVDKKDPIPASALYGWAALDLGFPYVNFTPSLGSSFPAALELAQRRGETGILKHLACFFKSPMGCDEHDFFKQMTLLVKHVADLQ